MTVTDKAARDVPGGGATGRRVWTALRAVPPIWVILLVVIAVLAWRNPVFIEPDPFANFLRRSAPLAILAAGQVYVIIAGEFDLSVGALVTAVVVVAARLSDGEAGHTWWLLLLLLAGGALVGLVNGLVTTRLRVPSFIATLGMLLVLNGAVFLWSGGAPRGSLADNFRELGRRGVEGVFGLAMLPYAVLILVAVGVGLWWLLSHSRFGHQVYAAGGNQRAAALSGVDVRRVRTTAFVISALCAVVAGVLLGGATGVTAEAGVGYEFQAIAAVVLGGAVLGGGRGSVGAAIAGALTLQALFSLLNQFGLAQSLRQVVQGVIIIGAAAYAARRMRRSG
ncbi:monosaccharide ABC transporter membrane protein (CUT2 family) [Micromonospora pisi]|uniref:Autoinducer 2 import system permease protein LsrD n=1 Tax=Micromonospora pisi TaxID=589240 RepID=A0A495JSX4_9ACTN|nr:ABC transporter permease [Micromonospora pisi]RKR92097.1 monosaccharide ABC transporter membrane protein (CUT2 family) [Micromonospora pisi]